MDTELRNSIQELEDTYDSYIQELEYLNVHRDFVNFLGFVVFFTLMEPYFSIIILLLNSARCGPK